MAKLTESQRETFEALRRAYLAEVPARIAAIREAAAEAGRGAPRAALEHLRHLVHQLVGSSAVFGLPLLSAAALALEDLVKGLHEGVAPGAGELERLTGALERTWQENAPPRCRESQG